LQPVLGLLSSLPSVLPLLLPLLLPPLLLPLLLSISFSSATTATATTPATAPATATAPAAAVAAAAHHAGVMLLYMHGVGSRSRSSSEVYQPMPKPSPFKLPNPKWLGREGSCKRSRASYDCLMIERSGPATKRWRRSCRRVLCHRCCSKHLMWCREVLQSWVQHACAATYLLLQFMWFSS
jgi:hypothetical protein